MARFEGLGETSHFLEPYAVKCGRGSTLISCSLYVMLCWLFYSCLHGFHPLTNLTCDQSWFQARQTCLFFSNCFLKYKYFEKWKKIFLILQTLEKNIKCSCKSMIVLELWIASPPINRSSKGYIEQQKRIQIIQQSNSQTLIHIPLYNFKSFKTILKTPTIF